MGPELSFPASLRPRPVVVAALIALAAFAAGRFSIRPAAPPPTSGGIFQKAVQLPPSPAAASGLAALAEDWSMRWRRLSAQSSCPTTDEAKAEALEALAAEDPSRALALALAERNRPRRAAWLHAALRGWARTDPAAAAAWIGRLPDAERDDAEGAVMAGAACVPAAAAALCRRLIQADPAGARSHANLLIGAFSRTGDYEAAAGFAASLSEALRPEIIGTAYQYWARSQPEMALAAASQLPEGASRAAALDAAFSGWSQVDPSGLAERALSLDSAAERSAALRAALPEWVQADPKAASDWIDHFDPKPEFDSGAAAVALQPEILAQRPDTAASWAESITDPALRSQTVAAVVTRWAESDPAAALRYAQSSPGLRPEDRQSLLAALARGMPPAP